MSGIIWLASYPKSGNTWLRVFLTNLARGNRSPADINSLRSMQFTTRELFDRYCGWKSSELRPEEITDLRLPIQHVLAEEIDDLPIKTHEIFFDLSGRPRFSTDATRVALYVIRNPLDVVVSLSSHLDLSVDDAISFLNDPAARITAPPGSPEFDQPIGDWSSHVLSWIDAPGLNVCVLRYEDMLSAPVKTFTAAVAATGINASQCEILLAVNHSRFEELQRQEQVNGFGERNIDRPFFRAGRSGGWREYISAHQVAKTVDFHRKAMERFGYLDKDGTPL